MKRIFSVLLVGALLFGMIPSAFAANDAANQSAQTLHELGLFSGTGVDTDGNPIFDLDRTPTRQEAVTMLVAMLGKTEEAKNGTWTTPFTDVDDWAKPFVGYAYANRLTSGTSATTYGGSLPVTAGQYLTFVLTALGYKSGTDFQWDKAWELSDQIGLTAYQYNAQTTQFTRGDVAVISLSAYELQEILNTAPYFGLPEDTRFKPNAETEEEYEHNLLYSYLIGNHNLIYPAQTNMYLWLRSVGKGVDKSLKKLSIMYPELVGPYGNMDANVQRAYANEKTQISYVQYHKRDVPATLTGSQIYEQQQRVLTQALEIKAYLRETGRIKEGMSEKQRVQVYYNYLTSLGIHSGIGKSSPTCVEYDSAYAALINKRADCVGRAAAFNLLMNVEGIAVQGVGGSIKGTNSGHALSRLVLDGEEYFCDWGSADRGLYKDISSWFEFDPVYLDAARAADP